MSQVQSNASDSSQQYFDISKIITDAGTQMRESINQETVANYAEILNNGGELPPLLVFKDETGAGVPRYYLVEGFHRIEAHAKLGHKVVPVIMQAGSVRDAKLHAIGDNATHGLPRTNADKRKAVSTLLTDAEWAKLSDSEIARRAVVSQPFVTNLRKDFAPPVVVPEQTIDTSTDQTGTAAPPVAAPATRTVTRKGKTFTMTAGNQHSKKKNASKGKPFAKFNDKMKAALSLIKSATKHLKQTTEYNAETGTFANAYAKFLSPSGTVVALDKLVASIESNLPGAVAESELGWITQSAADKIAASASPKAAKGANVKAGAVVQTPEAAFREADFKAKKARKAADKTKKLSDAKPDDAGLKATAESHATAASEAEKLAKDANDAWDDAKAKAAGNAPTGATPTL